MALTPTELKQTAEELLHDAEVALDFADDLPLPAAVKAFVEKAQTFVKAVDEFLQA